MHCGYSQDDGKEKEQGCRQLLTVGLQVKLS